jgi:hypothetical protein
VRFRTHSIRGLHENDFIMAAKVNRLLETGNPPFTPKKAVVCKGLKPEDTG